MDNNQDITKILIINGSPRSNGSTAILLKKIEQVLLGKKNINVKYINISDYQLLNCIRCMNCYKKGNCILDDQTEVINMLVADAQGIVLGSPTYVSSIPGSLKTYIDKGHFVLEQSLKGKYCFIISTYEIAGGGQVLKYLSTLIQYSGGILVGKFICKIPYNTLSISNTYSEVRFLREINKFYNAIKHKKRKSFFDQFINYIALHIIMKPQVLKLPKQYSAVIDRWKNLKVLK